METCLKPVSHKSLFSAKVPFLEEETKLLCQIKRYFKISPDLAVLVDRHLHPIGDIGIIISNAGAVPIFIFRDHRGDIGCLAMLLEVWWESAVGDCSGKLIS